MIRIEISDSLYQYDTYHISKAFFPNLEIKVEVIEYLKYDISFYLDDEFVFKVDKLSVLKFPGIEANDSSQQSETKIQIEEEVLTKKQQKHRVNQCLYVNLSKYTKRELDWGFMTGIRPTKMAMKKWLEYVGEIQNPAFDTYEGKKTTSDSKKVDLAKLKAIQWMQEYYNVTQRKSQLAVEIAMSEHELLQDIDLSNGYSLYIGIPFCLTRCSYCSFTAFPLNQWKDRMDEYLVALHKELEFVANKSKDKTLDTIYIGGGTPTTLEAEQLEELLKHIKLHFDWDNVKEITVEAGRPDTITREKLQVMKDYGVHRISINPQSMKQKTLCRVGRGHSVNQVYECFEMAREIGFDNINMDVILGLPYEAVEDVEYTLSELQKLGPESLTVHTLAMKRTSKLTEESTQVDQSELMTQMVEKAWTYAGEMGLEPYYLYRQKNIAGNYENVGYAKAGKACIYNVLIMEEKQSVIAVGAGSSTKIVLPREKDNIIRIENVKNVDDYITRIDEMIERKEEWLWH